jgi:hypothetical protein
MVARKISHPIGKLPDRVEWRECKAMEKRWNVSGAYAEWTMTLTTTPPEDADKPLVDSWSPCVMEKIGDYFENLVSLLEYYRELHEESGWRGSITV